MTKERQELPSGWALFHEFEEELKKQNRFFLNEKFLRLFDKIIENPYHRIIVKKGTDLYRGRKNPFRKKFKWVSDLGMNKENPSHNRASPIGISYMYLSDEPSTSISEIRPNVSDCVTVATFSTKKDLDFVFLKNESSYNGTIGEEFPSLEVAGFILYLSYAFSVPVQKQAELEYLPAQYFAEYCKKRGLSGIKYISCARGFYGFPTENNYNYVLFDEENLEYKEAFQYQIQGISYDAKKECPIHLKHKGEE